VLIALHAPAAFQTGALTAVKDEVRFKWHLRESFATQQERGQFGVLRFPVAGLRSVNPVTFNENPVRISIASVLQGLGAPRINPNPKCAVPTEILDETLRDSKFAHRYRDARRPEQLRRKWKRWVRNRQQRI
jgi:hypothetical protein